MVTIIIAMYNGAKFITQTIDSALAQDVQTEVIVIDDCSTDESLTIVENKFSKNKRVRIIKNTENLGFCKTVNKGIKEAKGKYVIILDQDDLLCPMHCSTALNYFINDKVGGVFTDYYLIDSSGVVIDKSEHCKHRDLKLKDFYFSNPIPAPGLVIKTNLLKEVGGYPELKEYENYGEYHLWIRMALVEQFGYCDETKAYYRRHQNNMTNQFNEKNVRKKLLKYYSICKKQLLIGNKISLVDKLIVIISMIKDIFNLWLK